jgi:hypothetical protein
VSTPWSALLDSATNALLALSQYPYVIAILAKAPALEAEEAHGVNWPHYRQKFALAEAPSHTYPTWAWVWRKREFAPTELGLITPVLRQRSLAAVKKCQAIWEVAYELSVVRYQLNRGVLLQETVYLTKRMEAARFKDAGYPEDELPAFPHVLYYTEWSGLSPRAAADEILFKAKLDDGILAKTELLRLKYFDLVKRAEVDELPGILFNFREETYMQPRL